MKKGIHPENYRLVVFKDMSNGYSFLSKSTAETKETEVWEDGNEYPLVKVEISHTSHPFFTGKMQFVDTAGRIDKFKSKYARHMKKGDASEQKKEEAPIEEPKEEVVEQPVEAVEETPDLEAKEETQEVPVDKMPEEESPNEEATEAQQQEEKTEE